MRRIAFLGIPLLYLLHDDFWLRDDTRIVFGLPVGLLYHAAYCGAASILMFALVRLAWPEHLEVDAPREDRR